MSLEKTLLNRYVGWSLHDLDETDIESLLAFVFFQKEEPTEKRLLYVDEAKWLFG